MRKQLKIAAVAALLAVGFTASAQTTSGSIGKQTTSTLGSTNTAVKVIDNKGTIKYLQSANGITQFTDTAPDGGEVTTWQLGGTLTSNTTITMADADSDGTSDQTFTINGDTFTLLGTDADTGAAAVADATDTTDGIANTGFTVLVRDEATGVIKKKLLADLLQVQTIGLNPDFVQSGNATADVPVTVTGLPAITAGTAEEYKLFVFRNGAKLRLGVDFNVTADTVTIINTEVPMYDGDVIEVQYIR